MGHQSKTWLLQKMTTRVISLTFRLALKGVERESDMLNGISLASLGATEVEIPVEGNLAVIYTLCLTPDFPREGDTLQHQIHSEVQTFSTPRKPRVVVLDCGSGGVLLAVKGSFAVAVAIDPHWKSLECPRSIQKLEGGHQTCAHAFG